MVRRARFSFGDDDRIQPPVIRDSFDDLEDLAILDERLCKPGARHPLDKKRRPEDRSPDPRQHTQDHWPTDTPPAHE